MTRSLAREVVADAVAAVRVVAERDDVGAGGEQLVGELRRDAGAVGDVLAVDDADVGAELLAQRRAAAPRPRAGPATPKTSARKRTLSSGPATLRGGARSRRGCPRRSCSARAPAARRCARFDDGAEARRAADDVRADRERRICAQLRERDDERRCALRLDVDARAEAMPADDVRRDADDGAVDRRVDVRARAPRRRRAPTARRRRAGTRPGCRRRRRRPCGRRAAATPSFPCCPIGASGDRAVGRRVEADRRELVLRDRHLQPDDAVHRERPAGTASSARSRRGSRPRARSSGRELAAESGQRQARSRARSREV